MEIEHTQEMMSQQSQQAAVRVDETLMDPTTLANSEVNFANGQSMQSNNELLMMQLPPSSEANHHQGRSSVSPGNTSMHSQDSCHASIDGATVVSPLEKGDLKVHVSPIN